MLSYFWIEESTITFHLQWLDAAAVAAAAVAVNDARMSYGLAWLIKLTAHVQLLANPPGNILTR